MTIKSSGSQLSFTEIEAEFGETDNRGLGQYRANDPSGAYENKNCGLLGPLPLDVGIPLDGEIKFSDFYGKRLNITVELNRLHKMMVQIQWQQLTDILMKQQKSR